MVSGSSKDDNPLPFGSSHWDKLPNEIKDMVLSVKTPLKLFLDGQFNPAPYREAKEIHKIWMEVFDTDWPGNLMSLPEPKESFEIRNHDLARVKSRSMYDRLCRRFPSACEINSMFAIMDRRVDRAVRPPISPKHEPLYAPPPTPFRLMHVAMRHVWLECLGRKFYKLVYARANDCIIEGHADMLRHLSSMYVVDLSNIKRVCILNPNEMVFNVMDVAAERGHLDILKILHEAGCSGISTKAMNWAAAYGHLDVVKWLHENRDEGCTKFAMNWAASGGHLDVVKFLHENRAEGCTTSAMKWAASHGNLEVFLWLRDTSNQQHTSEAMKQAVRLRHPSIFRFPRDNKPQGVSDDALFNCQTVEIANMLVNSLSSEAKRRIMAKANYEKRYGPGVDALRKSLK